MVKITKSNRVNFIFLDLDMFLRKIEAENNYYKTLLTEYNPLTPILIILVVEIGINGEFLFLSQNSASFSLSSNK